MIKFIMLRLLQTIPVILGVVFIVFAVMRLTPGCAATLALGQMATPDQVYAFNEMHGLNKPFVEQFVVYLIGIVTRGDLGISFTTNMPVTEEVLARFPTTFLLATMSVVLAAILGIPAGILSATKPYSLFDKVVTFFCLIGVSMPSFWQGLIMIVIFSLHLGWFPASGWFGPSFWVLPVLTIGTGCIANIMRTTRASMLEVIRQDYIRTARAKGHKESTVIYKHALRNALIPVVTIIGLQFGRQLGGAVVVEAVFAIPGLGMLLVNAIGLQNLSVVQGGVLLLAVVFSLVNLGVDIIYAYIDPRIRSQYKRSKKEAV